MIYSTQLYVNGVAVVYIPLKTESRDYVPAQTLTMKTVKANLKVV
jgi:hypothetical protein